MIIKGLQDEDFVNYKKPAMFIIFNKCDFKCDRENGTNYCYNMPIVNQPDISISPQAIYERYMTNPITKAVVCGGLEPMDTIDQLLELVSCFRVNFSCNDDIVIFTGYTEDEFGTGNYGDKDYIMNQMKANKLKSFKNIIIKYGRFRPNHEPKKDEALGIELASPNQYAVAYNMEG